MAAKILLYTIELQPKAALNLTGVKSIFHVSDAKNGKIPVETFFDEVLNSTIGTKWRQSGSIDLLGCRGFVLSYISELGSFCGVRYYIAPENTFCIELEGLEGLDSHALSLTAVERFVEEICRRLPASRRRQIAVVPRTTDNLNNICFASDQRMLVYDFDRVVCDEQSDYQHIQILHSPQFGNTLVIDDYVNLAESDLVYTHSIMRKGEIDYRDKEVLILGGGDGAILNEVLKESPKLVIMVDIDQKVLDVCRQHMRSACGTALDTNKGPNYEIIVSDCNPYLEKYAQEGKQFDYIFGDMTDVPVAADSSDAQAEFWQVTSRVLRCSINILKPGGRFLNHLVGVRNQVMVEQYEKMLTTWPLSFDKKITFIPSFLEKWVFYAIWPKDGAA